MQKSLDNLIALLDLEELEVNIFRGRCTEGWQRVFGGQVLAQALVAAGRTVDEGVAHSFHAYFLRPGDSTIGCSTISKAPPRVARGASARGGCSAETANW